MSDDFIGRLLKEATKHANEAMERDGFKEACAFDSIPEQDRYKPIGLVCNCPKCSPRC